MDTETDLVILFLPCLATAIDALRSTSRQLRQRALRTAAVSRSRNLGRRSTALGHALVLLADLLGDTARIADGRRISEIGIDTDEIRCHSIDADVADHNIARASIVCAVTTGAVHFADADKGRVFDRHGSAAIVLDDLVLGRVGSAALPEDVTGAEGGDGVCVEDG